MSREGDDRQVAQRGVAANPLQDLVAVHAGQRDVEQHEVRLGARNTGQGIRTIFVLNDVVLVAEDRLEQQPIVGVVLDDGEGRHALTWTREWRPAGRTPLADPLRSAARAVRRH